MKRALIYARVSTDEQAARGYSLPSQTEACRQYATSHGFSVVAELADDCSGAIPIQDRPQGRKVYEQVDAGTVDAVILFTHDRTARDDKVIEYILFKSHLYDKGVELHYSDNGLDPYTMEGNLIGYIKAHGAAEERKKIIERTRRGKENKAKANKMVLNGHHPYGYRTEGKSERARLEIYEPEAQIVRRIYQWYLYGDGQNDPMSLRAIAIRLDEMGVPKPEGKSITARYWHTFTVRNILTNELYIGKAYYGKVRVVNKKRVPQPRENWIEIDVPELAIIDRETFNAVQVRKNRNSERAKRNRKRKYLLAGHFKCGECNRAMCGNHKTAAGYSRNIYRCGTYARRDFCPNMNHSIRGDKVDVHVWDWIVGLVSDDAKLDKGLGEMMARSEAELEPKRQRLIEVSELYNKVEQKIKRLVSRLGDEEDETISAAVMHEVKMAKRQKDGLMSERQTLESELAQKDITVEMQEAIRARARVIRHKLVNPTFEQKRGLLDALNVQVIFIRADDGTDWIKVRCALMPDGEVNEFGLSQHPPEQFRYRPALEHHDQEIELIELSPS